FVAQVTCFSLPSSSGRSYSFSKPMASARVSLLNSSRFCWPCFLKHLAHTKCLPRPYARLLRLPAGVLDRSLVSVWPQLNVIGSLVGIATGCTFRREQLVHTVRG